MESIKTKIMGKVIFILMLLILLIFVMASFAACNSEVESAEKTAEEESARIEAVVERRDMSSKINLNGIALAGTRNSIITEVGGEMLFIADRGETVMEDDVLAEIDGTQALEGLAEIEMSIENAQSFLRIARISYQTALDENHIAIQLAEINAQRSEESARSALAYLESANRSAQLSLESARQAYGDAREMLEIAQSDPATSEMEMAQYESAVEYAENNIESIKSDSRSSQSQAESSYGQSVLDQSSTYWNNLSSMQQAEAQIAIAAESIKQAELQVEAAQLELKAAEERLNKYTLAAPYDCLVTSVTASEGNKIYADQQMMEVIDHNSIIVRADLPEVDKNSVTEDMEANIYFNAYPDNVFGGNVFRIDRIPVNTSAGAFYEIFIEFTDLNDIELVDVYGLNAEVEIITSGGDNILVVPVDFVYTEGTQKYVYRITGENEVEKTYIETGISELSYMEIASGLEEGDRVVINR